MKKALGLAVLAALVLPLMFGSPAKAGECPAAVQVQQVALAQPVVVAQPVYVVPGAPTVQLVQQVAVAQPVVVQQFVAPPVVQRQVIKQQVVQQRIVQPRARSLTIQRSVIR